MATIMLVPAYELVTLKITWTKGKPVEVSSIELRSPKVKHKVTSMPNPRTPSTTKAHIKDRGRIRPASFVSSAAVGY